MPTKDKRRPIPQFSLFDQAQEEEEGDEGETVCDPSSKEAWRFEGGQVGGAWHRWALWGGPVAYTTPRIAFTTGVFLSDAASILSSILSPTPRNRSQAHIGGTIYRSWVGGGL